jgi:hypothetical protein
VLAFAHPVAFADVHPQRHQLEIGDDVIQLRSHGEGDDVIDGKRIGQLSESLAVHV